jgi:hypothetical protein
MQWWWELFLALRFIVLGAVLFVVGALLFFVAWGKDEEILVVGLIVFVAGASLTVLGVVLWPRSRGAGLEVGGLEKEVERQTGRCT